MMRRLLLFSARHILQEIFSENYSRFSKDSNKAEQQVQGLKAASAICGGRGIICTHIMMAMAIDRRVSGFRARAGGRQSRLGTCHSSENLLSRSYFGLKQARRGGDDAR